MPNLSTKHQSQQDKTYNIDDIIKARQISYEDGYQTGLIKGYNRAGKLFIAIVVLVSITSILISLLS